MRSQLARYWKPITLIFVLLAAGAAYFKWTEIATGISALENRIVRPRLGRIFPPGPTAPVFPTMLPAAASLSPEPVATASPEGPATEIGTWQLFEIVLESTHSYDNPFTEVDVTGEFVSPSGRRVQVFGFHDGDGQGGQGSLWKIRFMDGEAGRWTWNTRATDPSNAGLDKQSGEFMIVPSDTPGPVLPDTAYPSAWKFADGGYFYWDLGYSIYILGAEREHPTLGGWMSYLDWLEEHKIGGVMFLLQVPGFGTCTTCQAGMAPWEAIGNSQPPEYAFNNRGRVDYLLQPWASSGDPDSMGRSRQDTDFFRFYLPFWVRLDELLNEMASRNMVANVYMYADQTFWPAAETREETIYFDYILRRLGGHWNVTYNDGIDLFEYRSKNWVAFWQAYFQANDPFNHARSSRHGADDMQTSTWRSMQAANDRQPTKIENWRRLLGAPPMKPVTEDDGIRAGKGAGISTERFAQLAWWSALAGPGGFGATWAGLYEPGNWYARLADSSPVILPVTYRNRLIQGFDPANGLVIPFWKLEDHDELVEGTGVYASAVPGAHYLIYFDLDASSSVRVDLSAVSEALPVTWMNPLTGETLQAEEVATGRSSIFTNPFDGPAVLYIGQGEPNEGAGAAGGS